MVKIGFYTSTFNDRPLEEVVDFAASAGFDAIEIDVGGHIKTPDRVADAVALARQRNLFVSSLTYFGNQLDADRDKRRELRARTAEFARAIGETGVPIFVIFPGRDDSAGEEANYDDFADFANGLIAETRSSGLTFAIENWPGPKDNFVGTTPKGWQALFARIPDRRFGLEFDPSHLIRIGVDPYRALEAVKDRIAILHAKDTAIDREALQALVITAGAGGSTNCRGLASSTGRVSSGRRAATVLTARFRSSTRMPPMAGRARIWPPAKRASASASIISKMS